MIDSFDKRNYLNSQSVIKTKLLSIVFTYCQPDLPSKMKSSLIRKIHLLLLFVFLIPNPSEVEASHFMGIDIRMECMNSCTSRVHWRAYRDCTGSNILSNTILFTPVGPGCVAPTTLGNASAQITNEVTPVCASFQTRCTNTSSTLNGVQEFYTFQDYDLCAGNPPGCDWDLSWTICCRNGVITSGSGNQGVQLNNYHSTTLGCNNSPIYLNYPLFYACAGTSTNIQMGGFDPDGDSLVYSLGPCYAQGNTQITYNGGYSQSAPLGSTWNVSIDPSSGILDLTPNPGNQVVGVLCITTHEYRNGTLIGINTRDIQVAILSCSSNTAPSLQGISNLNSNAVLSAPDVVSVCEGVPVSFDITAIDPDTASGQVVTMLWDQSIAGATFTEAGNPAVTDTVVGNSPDGTFSWSNTVAGVYPITIGLRDNNCPVFTFADEVIYLVVVPSTFAGQITASPSSVDTCLGTTSTLSVPGGPFSSFAWSTAATTPTIQVSQPGTYTVTVTYQQGSCNSVGFGSVQVTGTGTPMVSGTVTLSNGITPLSNAPVYLVVHDSTLNALTAVDTTTTDASGYYEFCTTMGADTFYLKAAPQLPANPNHLPTYADTAVYFNNAEFLLSNASPQTVNWSVRSGSNPGGPGFIGGLISQGANKTQGVGDPMPDVPVFLYSTTSSQFIGSTTTDANGYFSFSSIPLGNYKISVDAAGVDEVNVPAVTLSNQIPSLDSLDLRLHSTYLELFVPTNITTEPISKSYFTVYPNPSTRDHSLLLYLVEDAQVEISVHDIMGRKVMTLVEEVIGKGKRVLTLNGLQTGAYFLKVIIGEEEKVMKIVRL